MSLQSRIFKGPVGDITLVADDASLQVLAWGPALERLIDRPALEPGDGHPLLDRACDQLTRYFAGELKAFDLPLAPQGTEFQRRVWEELGRIPYGTSISYQELARRVGQPGASRAVGAVNGRNPLWIVLPCHRVVSSTGQLTGYAGGIDAKRYLLALEGAPPSTR